MIIIIKKQAQSILMEKIGCTYISVYKWKLKRICLLVEVFTAFLEVATLAA